MDFVVTLGRWLLPVLLILLVFTWAFWNRPEEQNGFLPNPGPLRRLIVAVVGSVVGLAAYITWLG